MIIKVKVKPKAGKNLVEMIVEGEYIVFVKARAEDGKANMVVRKLLAKKFGVSILDVRIKTPKSRQKIVEIFNLGTI